MVMEHMIFIIATIIILMDTTEHINVFGIVILRIYLRC